MISRKKSNEVLVNSVMSELFFDSRCTKDPKEKAYLHKLLNNRKFVMILLYRGSRDGWTSKDFHRLCDGKSPTISLLKIKNGLFKKGPCIGGYTEA
jgi:hypothetical protein